MALYAGGFIPWLEQRFFTSTGAVLGLGKVYTYAAGTSTPLACKTSATLVTSHTNPIILGADGRPPNPIFLQPTGYKFVVTNSSGVEQYTIDLVEDVGQVFAQTLGVILSEGSKDVTSGYIVLSTDYFVTVASTGGPSPCIVTLLASAAASKPLAIKNLGTVAISVTPDGADTIEGVNGIFTIPAGAPPVYPTIVLVPDGVSAWHLWASHKVP